MIAGWHEQTDTSRPQDPHLARRQRSAQASRRADDLVGCVSACNFDPL